METPTDDSDAPHWWEPIVQAPRHFWWAMQRRHDLRVLWPICKQLANDRAEAKAAFMAHAAHDACWIDYYGEAGLKHFVDTLR